MQSHQQQDHTVITVNEEETESLTSNKQAFCVRHPRLYYWMDEAL
jgi:hypothetical protein